jgi:copper chaperone CopZ
MTCAYAVRGALKKFSGVESVEVSLNQGLATVKLKPGNTVQPQEFWQAVRKSGFTPKETRVVVRGEITSGGQKQFKVAGTNQLFELKGDPKMLDDAIGKPIVIDGVLIPGKDLQAAVPLEARQIRGDQ